MSVRERDNKRNDSGRAVSLDRRAKRVCGVEKEKRESALLNRRDNWLNLACMLVYVCACVRGTDAR